MTFANCDRGVYKPSGNIGNHFTDCLWSGNNYGVYANGVPTMQVGSDRYQGGHFDKHSLAAIRYYDKMDGTGQIIIDGTVFEGNAGFAVFLYFESHARLTYNAICLRNVWFEDNGGALVEGVWVNNQITLGATTYTASDLYIHGVRSVRIDDSDISRIQLVESSVNLYNCRSDNARAVGYMIVEVDGKSSLVAYELRYNFQPSEYIFVNSISYDGTPDIGGTQMVPTSVWGPLRVVNQVVMPGIKVSVHFDGSLWPFDYFGGSTPALDTTPVNGGILTQHSGQITLAASTSIWSADVYFFLDNDVQKYYVWSIHTYLEADGHFGANPLTGTIISEDSMVALGQVFFKQNQWVCSYGMKLIRGSSSSPKKMRLAFQSFANTCTFKICDYQVVVFDDLSAAESFINSRAFARSRPEDPE